MWIWKRVIRLDTSSNAKRFSPVLQLVPHVLSIFVLTGLGHAKVAQALAVPYRRE